MARPSTPWALLPAKELGCGSATTCWRRFDEWARAGVFDQVQALLLDELGEAGRLDLERVSVDSFSLRAVKGGTSPWPCWPARSSASRRFSGCHRDGSERPRRGIRYGGLSEHVLA
jgi:transposase